jgi:hypothetical protein
MASTSVSDVRIVTATEWSANEALLQAPQPRHRTQRCRRRSCLGVYSASDSGGKWSWLRAAHSHAQQLRCDEFDRLPFVRRGPRR